MDSKKLLADYVKAGLVSGIHLQSFYSAQLTFACSCQTWRRRTITV